MVNNNYKKINIETPTLVISTNDFIASKNDQLNIRENEFLVVTDWNYKEGWVYGHRRSKEEEKGIFPKIFIKICEDDRNKDGKNQIN